MVKIEQKSVVQRVLDLICGDVSEEIKRIFSSGRGGISSIREISLRRGGVCRVVTDKESIRLSKTISKGDMEIMLKRLTDGALYAHRDTIASGYISLFCGVRVGVCGYAKYDGDRLVGISDISSLLFRIPGGGCAFGDEICSVFRSGVRSGMLIYSPPGVGKTTAIRHLARAIGSGPHPTRISVVDERLEFCESDYLGCDVDILRGYKRRTGIEIATRTLSPALIIIDEIGGDDATSICEVIRCGIPIIATAHASSFEEVMAKKSLSPLISLGAFDLFVGISRAADGYRLKVDRL